MNSKKMATSEIMATLGGVHNVRPGSSEYSVEGITPVAIVRPTNMMDLSKSIATASENDIAIAPMGGRTRIDIGNRPNRLDAVIELTALDNIIDYNPADLTLTVESGTCVTYIQKELAKQGQFLAIDPPLPGRSTIGGTLAVGFSGLLKWQYGHLRDLVIGMSVVQANGKISHSGGKVVKNVSGYDMAKLHIGGFGTLGIIAEVSFKLTPLPHQESTIIASFDQRDYCTKAGLDIFHSNIMPLALCTFDGAINRKSQCVDTSRDSLLAIKLGGRPLTMERQIRECSAICHDAEAKSLDVVSGTSEPELWRKLSDFGWTENTTPSIACRISIQPSSIATLVDDLVMKYDHQLALITDPGYGTVLAFWFLEPTDCLDEKASSIIANLVNTVSDNNGSVVIERCPADIKPQLDVWGDIGASLPIMQRLKDQYDPKAILNPGRFAGGI